MFAFSPQRFHSILLVPALYSLVLIAGANAPNGAPVAGNDSYTIHGCALPLNPPLVANDFGGIGPVGRELFAHYLFSFEILSLLLLVALVGVVVLARRRAH